MLLQCKDPTLTARMVDGGLSGCSSCCGNFKASNAPLESFRKDLWRKKRHIENILSAHLYTTQKILAFTVVRQCKENAVDCEIMNNSYCVMNRKLDNFMIILLVRYSGRKETRNRSLSSVRKRCRLMNTVSMSLSPTHI